MKKNFTLIIIIILAGFLRFNQLGSNPPSLNLDEVAIGYNAYSVLETGQDEYGEPFPLAFRSHDDYKPPLYIYLTVPSIAIFGLNEFAVRLPSALAGTLTVLVTYFLVLQLFGNKSERHKTKAIKIASTASLLLAINPWHLQYSRAAYEVTVAIFFITSGTWAFLAGFRNSKYWYLSALSYALALYVYQAVRLFLPLFFLALLLIYIKQIRKEVKKAMLPLILFLLLVAPLVPIMTSTAGLMRFRGTSVFGNPGVIEEEMQRVKIDAQRQDPFAIKVLHNRRVAALTAILDGYLKHFRPDFLFLGRNGPPLNFTPNVGLLYLAELPLIILGLASLKDNKNIKVLLGWLLLAPLPSALTWDVPSATRMAIILPTLQIFSAAGLILVLGKLKQKNMLAKIASLLLIVFLVFNLSYYLHQYYVHAPIEYAEAWQYGYKQAVEFSQEHEDEYDQIIASTNLRQPQNFFAFYTKYDPKTYINVDGGTVSGGFLETENSFGKFKFHPIDYGKLDKNQRLLLVDTYDSMPSEYKDKAVKIIALPNGEPFIAISTS